MKISVCMASYNGDKYIKEQIDSILPQLNENDELVISDDGSTDGTLNIINFYGDKRIKLFHNKKDFDIKNSHIAVARNFENALNNSTGDFIFLSDQDDIWMNNKVSCILPYFDKYDLIVTDSYSMENDVIDYDSSRRNGQSPILSLWGKIKGLEYQGCCMAFKREVLIKALPFPKNLPLHDGWIGLIAEYTGTVFFLNERLFAFRYHNNNVSKGQNKNSTFFKIRYRIKLFLNILIRKFFIEFIKH